MVLPLDLKMFVLFAAPSFANTLFFYFPKGSDTFEAVAGITVVFILYLLRELPQCR